MNISLQTWVDEAVKAAMYSPCQSKRGAIIVWDEKLISTGFNYQPSPFECDGSDQCKKYCGKTAVHAEQDAILSAMVSTVEGWMLHVKAKQGKPCASMAPSCLECSKLILACGLSWMHLLHDPEAQILPGAEIVAKVEGFRSNGELGMLDVRRYSAAKFHWLTAEYFHNIHLILPCTKAEA